MENKDDRKETDKHGIIKDVLNRTATEETRPEALTATEVRNGETDNTTVAIET